MFSDVQGREKIALIELFTVMGFDILITDVDAIWCGLAPTTTRSHVSGIALLVRGCC